MTLAQLVMFAPLISCYAMIIIDANIYIFWSLVNSGLIGNHTTGTGTCIKIQNWLFCIFCV